MNKKILILGVLFLILLGSIGIYFFSTEEDLDSNFRSSNWSSKYLFEGKEPYGLFYFNAILRDKAKNSTIQEILSENYLDSALQSNKKSMYILIGDTVTLKQDQYISLLKKVKDQGAGLLLICQRTYSWAMDSLGLDGDLQFVYSRNPVLKSNNAVFPLYHLYQADTVFGKAFGLNGCTKPPLIQLQSLLIETKFNYGKGSVVFGTFPRSLVNYQLINPRGLAHVKLLIDQCTGYDNYYFVSFANLKWNSNYQWEEPVNSKNTSLLKLIVEEPALKKGVYALMLGLILLAFFYGKRKQAILQLPKEPDSLTKNYLQTISSIYRSHESPPIAFQMVKTQFYFMIRQAYYTDISKWEFENQFEFLSEKAKDHHVLAKETLSNLHLSIETIEMHDVYAAAQLSHRFLVAANIIKPENNPKIFPLRLHRRFMWNVILMIFGILGILIGLYSLARSNEAGSVGLLLGALFLALGILRYRTPYLSIDEEKSYFYPLIGGKIQVIAKYLTENNSLSFEKESNHETLSIPNWDFDALEWQDIIKHFKHKSHGRSNQK